MKPKTYLITLSAILIIFMLIQGGFYFYASKKFDCNPYAMEFNRTAGKYEQIEGLYNHEGYFCVWTKDRSPEAIAETTFHELAHYYNDYNPEHFTEGVKK